MAASCPLSSPVLTCSTTGLSTVFAFPSPPLSNHSLSTAYRCSLRPHIVRATTIRTGDSGSAGDVEFAAAAACCAGQQVFHMYSSDLSNAELLLSYGFTIPDNENDTVVVEIEAPEEAWRTRLLPFVAQHYLTRCAPLPLQLQHAVALVCCSKLELKSRLKDGAWPAEVLQRARQLLLSLLQVCSKRYEFNS
jgi:hypothetical protein